MVAMFESRRILRQVERMANARGIVPVVPIVSYSINVEGAFIEMQKGEHKGKIVWKIAENDVIKVFHSPIKASFPNNSTYLIVGGLGGICASMARRLATRGRRQLVLASRSAALSSEAQRKRLRDLEKSGVQVMLRSCGVADCEQLSAVLDELPPISGII